MLFLLMMLMLMLLMLLGVRLHQEYCARAQMLVLVGALVGDERSLVRTKKNQAKASHRSVCVSIFSSLDFCRACRVPYGASFTSFEVVRFRKQRYLMTVTGVTHGQHKSQGNNKTVAPPTIFIDSIVVVRPPFPHFLLNIVKAKDEEV